MKVILNVSALMLVCVVSACSTVYYAPGYSKDGVRSGYEPDLEICKSEHPDSASARDACMSDKGWTRSDAIKVEQGE